MMSTTYGVIWSAISILIQRYVIDRINTIFISSTALVAFSPCHRIPEWCTHLQQRGVNIQQLWYNVWLLVPIYMSPACSLVAMDKSTVFFRHHYFPLGAHLFQGISFWWDYTWYLVHTAMYGSVYHSVVADDVDCGWRPSAQCACVWYLDTSVRQLSVISCLQFPRTERCDKPLYHRVRVCHFVVLRVCNLPRGVQTSLVSITAATAGSVLLGLPRLSTVSITAAAVESAIAGPTRLSLVSITAATAGSVFCWASSVWVQCLSLQQQSNLQLLGRLDWVWCRSPQQQPDLCFAGLPPFEYSVYHCGSSSRICTCWPLWLTDPRQSGDREYRWASATTVVHSHIVTVHSVYCTPDTIVLVTMLYWAYWEHVLTCAGSFYLNPLHHSCAPRRPGWLRASLGNEDEGVHSCDGWWTTVKEPPNCLMY